MVEEPDERVPPMEETMKAIMKTFAEIEAHLLYIAERLGVPPDRLGLDPPDRSKLG